MNPAPSVRRNWLLNISYSGMNIAFPVATMAYAGRVIGPALMGSYYVAASLAGYFFILAGLGIPMYGAREVARRRGNPGELSVLCAELALLNAFASLACFAAFAAIVYFVPAFSGNLPLFLLCGGVVLFNAFSVDYLFIGLEDFGNIAFRNLIAKSLGLVLLFALVRGPGDLLWFASIGLTVFVVGNAMGAAAAIKRSRPDFRKARPAGHFRPLLILTLILVVTALYTNLDSVTLGLLAGDREVGIYNAGVRIAKIMVIFVTSIGIVLLPRLSEHHEHGRETEFTALIRKSLGLVAFLGLPCAAMVASASDAVAVTAFGPAFSEAGSVLRISAPLILVIGLTNCLGMQVLFPKGEEKLILASVAAAAAVNVALNLLLIPMHGAQGAAWATLAAETTVLAVQVAASWKRHSLASWFDGRMAGYALASLAAAVPFWLPFPGGAPLLVKLVVCGMAGGAMYVGILAAFRDPIALELLARCGIRARKA